ncbi:uncharacterized protein E0L32_002414 [Thyridium curvatum]|uniref:Uncharacterized protein n=1 Tax=Thyridium curvatum TaxID=1093900 RepID=A0A507BF16_9PEZI|nr:uncharacterized protein E0L32_002414 [Thyridium curvatum]TPX18557.1 hypothetical protein E0L32_002414 [Thyridium curvatum]
MASTESQMTVPVSYDSDPEEIQDAGMLQQNADSALEDFIHDYPRTNVAFGAESPPRLRNPVVIPQRRPGNKERGFIKAYAPDLEEFGIDEESFLAFIRATNKAAQASKWLYAIQVAAMGTGFIPNHIALGVSAAVQIIAGIVAKAETRWKTNSFMDRMNDEFFRPRGLYCLIMSYNPIAMDKKEKIDPSQAISDHGSSSSQSGLLDTAKRKLRSPAAGVSQGQESLPESVATLVYPDVSKPTTSPSSGANKKKKAFARLNDYFDRRAQARYIDRWEQAAESKGDVLSAPQRLFSNRFLDPNHPASNGGLLGLLSGGKLTPNMEKQKESMRSAMAAQEQAIRDQQSLQMANLNQVLQGMGLTPEQQRDYVKQYEQAYEMQLQQFQQQSELLEHGQRRINRNILYLLIVNMPTGAELEAAQNQELPSNNQQITTNNVVITDVNVE